MKLFPLIILSCCARLSDALLLKPSQQQLSGYGVGNAQSTFELNSSMPRIEKVGLAAELNSSVSLNDAIQLAAGLNSIDASTAQFLRSLKLCARCGNYGRVGPQANGGYIVCEDGLANSGLRAAYSYGINGHDGWGMDLASRYHLPLFEYDCFNTKRPTPCSGCQANFFPQCIKGNHDPNPNPAFRTLQWHLSRNGHDAAPDSSIMLKIDVDGAEWSVLPDMAPQELRKFRQINLELHDLKNFQNNPKQKAMQAMQTVLRAGFAVTHLHGNNCCGMVNVGPYSVPRNLEVTLIRRQPDSPQCAPNIPYRLPSDARVLPSRPELPNAVLPKLL